MKINFVKSKSFYFQILLIISIQIYGQEYNSFIDTNSVWRDRKLINYSHASSSLFYELWDAQEKLGGDTIIGEKYYKLYRTGIKQYYYYSHGVEIDSTLTFCNLYIGGLREDSNKRVFYIDLNNTESLLFDFNLTIGDTLKQTYLQRCQFHLFCNINLIVISIDSIKIFNKYRKRFNLKGAGLSNNISIIEGIGTELGIFGLVDSWDGEIFSNTRDYLFAYYYKNIKVYNGYNLDNSKELLNCSIFDPVNSNKMFVGKYNIFPNPANQFLEIVKLGKTSSRQEIILITDYLGRELYQYDIKLNHEYINISNLKDGLYFLRIYDSQGENYVYKFLKESN